MKNPMFELSLSTRWWMGCWTQEAKKYLANPLLKERDFQGTIILGHKGVEEFLEGETER
jgi:hypothetical protein